MFTKIMFFISSVSTLNSAALTPVETNPFEIPKLEVSQKQVDVNEQTYWQWECLTKGCEYVSNIHDSYISASRYALAHSTNYEHGVHVYKIKLLKGKL
ncbi:hypothetical protein [Xylocopilactobacillus apis]|uniref:Uncharacterized protein n=1 Tax=Xylocopilactobacillus apis TaxID=2932183 RepID=A0AAU9CNV0_9LACO|nr:hypothetical protein [Xylocopilactobacillus apis]BDR55627.1 hypothetical protein KIMC2_01890 [Xylocopilactobacillus apis]